MAYNRTIPGHAWADTIPATIALLVAAGVKRWAEDRLSLAPPPIGFVLLGIVLLSLGLFLSAQATHLAQNHHEGPPDSWIEDAMQVARSPFVWGGRFLACVGVLFAI